MHDDQRKRWLYRGAIVFAVLTAGAAFFQPEGAWPLLALAVACAVLAHVDQLGDITATVAGMNISLKRAETAVQQISELAVKIDERNRDVIGHITGGESYPYIRVVPKMNTQPSRMIVEVVGEHALREVDIRVLDAALNPMTEGAHVRIGYIAVGTIKEIAKLFDDARQADNGRLIIFYSALNGVMIQFLDYRNVEGDWRFASCVLAHGKVHKRIDPNFGPQPSDWDAERVRLGIELKHEPKGKIS